MNKIAATMFNILAILSAIIGAVILGSQLQSEEEVVWHIPLILIGCGVGFPIFISFALPHFSDETDEYDQLDQYADSTSSQGDSSSFSDDGETD